MPVEAVIIDTTISAVGTRLREYGNPCIVAKDGYATETFDAPGASGKKTFEMSQTFTDVKQVYLGDTEYVLDSSNSYPSTPDPGKYNYSTTEQEIVCNVADGDKAKTPNLQTYCYNKVLEFSTIAAVEDQFGSGTDVANAAEMIFTQQVKTLWIVRAEIKTVTDEAAADVDDVTMTLAHVPPCGETLPTIKGDGVSATVKWDPLCAADHLPSSASGEAWVNPITGFVGIDDNMISGTGAGLVVTSYTYIDWAAINTAISNEDINIVVLADTPTADAHLGDLDKLIGYCDSNNWIMPIMSNATTAANIITQFNYLTDSRNVMGIATTQTDDDIAACGAGLLANLKPWDNVMWQRLHGLSMQTYFTTEEVESTLEGSEVNPVNAVIRKIDTDVMSNGLTTVGGDYKYIDITRTKYYLEDLIRDRLTTLLMGTKLTYEKKALAVVASTIRSACEEAVHATALREPWYDEAGDLHTGYIVEMPAFEDIPTADRVNRVLRNVFVTAYLAGHIQEIRLNLLITI